SLRPEVIEKIETVCMSKGISNFFVESLTNGYNHSIIGYKLAEKWNFPKYIIDAIRYHHIPAQTTDDNRFIVFITYLSNSIYYYKRNMVKFEHINQRVLKTFNLENRENFDVLCKGLFAKFENSLKN
ncbi:MAG TPA: HDOD domain-containing protein, partial [Spirochaetota bacterium]|nr:HDOD domain-containing protein [Spirochaetota bacterium]